MLEKLINEKYEEAVKDFRQYLKDHNKHYALKSTKEILKWLNKEQTLNRKSVIIYKIKYYLRRLL